MVGLYKHPYHIRYVVLLGYLQSLCHVTYYYPCAILRLQARVGVHARLVFGEEHWVLHLAYVMIQGACSHQQTLGSYLSGYGSGKVAHHYRVLEGAWCLF